MAILSSIEKNIKLELFFDKNEIDNSKIQRRMFEIWVPLYFKLEMPRKVYVFDESNIVTVTLYEMNKMVLGIKKLQEHLENKQNYVFEFNHGEAFFGIKMESLPEDDVAEIEIWINIANYTKGEICGYDEGVRFVTELQDLRRFVSELDRNV